MSIMVFTDTETNKLTKSLDKLTYLVNMRRGAQSLLKFHLAENQKICYV